MSTSDGVLHCRLIGGPLDGLPVEEWLGIQTIIMSDKQEPADETHRGVFHIYKRCKPDVFTIDGLTEFHYFVTRENPTE